MSEIRRVNTGDAPRNVYHAGDAPRTVNTGRTVKTGSALNQDEYEAARRRAQQLAANNTRRTRSFNRVQQTDVDRYRAAQQKEQEARAAAAQQQAQEAHAAREAAARQQAQAAAQSEQPLTRAQRQALELQRRARSQSAQGATRTQVRRLDLNETKGSRAHYDMNADAEYQARVARRAAQPAAQPAAPQAAPQQEDTVMQASRSARKPAAGSGKSAAGRSGSKSAAGGGGKPPKGGSRKGKGGAGPYGPNGKKKKKGGWWKVLLGTLLAIAVIFFGTVAFIMHAIAPSAGSISLNQLINTPKEYAGKEFNLLVVGIDRSTETGQETDSQVDDGMTDMILYLHFNNETGQVKMLQIPRNIFVTTDASFSGNYQINAIAKTQGTNGSNNISALADEIYNIFGLHVDGYLSVRLEALTQIIDTFGGIQVYVPQDMDYGGSHLSQGYQTMDGAAAEFFLRTRHIYADSDLGRLRMQRYFYAALFARMRSMTAWDIAKLLPVITSQMETDLSATELVSVAVSMLKIHSDKICLARVPVYMGDTLKWPLNVEKPNSVVVVAKQETADVLNQYFRAADRQVDASELNVCQALDTSGMAPQDAAVKVMNDLNKEVVDAQQNNNHISEGDTGTDVYEVVPDSEPASETTDGDSTAEPAA